MLTLSVCLSVVVRVVSATCHSSKVLALPVQNVLLSNHQVMRGVPLSAGTPAQNFSLMPTGFYNDTWLYNTTTTFCSSLSLFQQPGCITQRGGLYDWSSSSSSSKPATDVFQAGGDPSDTIDVIGQQITGSSFIEDILRVGDAISLPQYPIGMPGLSINTFYNTQGHLGLGSNSTLLNALVTAGTIVSRSYSWWWGLQGSTTESTMDGQLVFGGYDAAKVQGQNYTQRLSPPSKLCYTGMSVTISDIVVNFSNGTSASIISPESLTTCIYPDWPMIAYFPWKPYFDRFESLTGTSNLGTGGGNGLAFEGMLYPMDNVFDGSVTISINDNFAVTFPNDLLVVPPSKVESDGALFTNHSVAELLLGPTTDDVQLTRAAIGKYFFQSSYLTVDFDTQIFTISHAVPVTESNLVSLGGKCSSPTGDQSGTGSTTSAAPGEAHTSTPSTSQGHSGNGSISTTTLVGIVIGSTFAIALAASAAILCLLRRRKAHNEKDGGQNMRDAGKSKMDDQPFGGYVRGGLYHEAMSKELAEMSSRRSQMELEAASRPLELTTDPASRVRRERYLEGLNSPVELA